MVDTTLLLAALICLLGIAVAIVYAGRLAYEARTLRERAWREASARPSTPDPIVELARLNAQAVDGLREAQRNLEATARTLQRGIRG